MHDGQRHGRRHPRPIDAISGDLCIMDVRTYRFTMDSYNAPVKPFCSLTNLKVPLLLIKEPPLILTLLEFWIIVAFKGGSRQLKDFVAVVVM